MSAEARIAAPSAPVGWDGCGGIGRWRQEALRGLGSGESVSGEWRDSLALGGLGRGSSALILDLLV